MAASAPPLVDHLDWSTVDVILITHFHLDHVGASTYIMEKVKSQALIIGLLTSRPQTNFREGKGKHGLCFPFMFFSTGHISDRVSSLSSLGVLFTAVDVSRSLPSIIPVSDTFPGLDRHLVKAEIPPIRPDILIVESTYGIHTFESRQTRETRFTNLVTALQSILNEPEEILSMKGTLIPRKMNSDFIELVDAEHAIMVHGEQTTMGRLRAAMEARYKERGIDRKIYTPTIWKH